MCQKLESITSFDPIILQDQLIKVLKRSPQTITYTQNRVTQIIIQIMSIPLIETLKSKVQELQAIIEQLLQEKQLSGSLTYKNQTQYIKTIKLWKQQKKQLQKQIYKYQHLQIENQQYLQIITSLKQQKISSEKQKQQLSNTCTEISQILASKNNHIQQLNKQIENLKIFNNNKNQQIKELNTAYQKLKKNNKQTKYNEIKLKKQCEISQLNLQEITTELAKTKEQLKIQKSHRDNQRKAMHTKLNELYWKCKKGSKVCKKLHTLSIINDKIKKQLLTLKQNFVLGIEMLQSSFKHVSNSIMDQIGDQISRQLKQVMSQMTRCNLDIRLLRQQARIKDDIIQLLEKASSVQIMGNRQLQKQLKQKKITTDLLRKQIKKNFQDHQNKSLQFQQQYKQTMINIGNFRV